MVVTGNPEDDSNQSFAGSVQFFYNSAWQSRERFELAPIIEGNSSTQFSTAEDSSGFLHDFNGSHPFDSNNTWSIAETNASISSYEINATSGVFSFVPDANFSGNLFFRSTLKGMDGSDEHNFSINVSGAPDPPIFLNLLNSPCPIQWLVMLFRSPLNFLMRTETHWVEWFRFSGWTVDFRASSYGYARCIECRCRG